MAKRLEGMMVAKEIGLVGGKSLDHANAQGRVYTALELAGKHLEIAKAGVARDRTEP